MSKKLFTLIIAIGFLWIGKANAQCNLTADFGRNPRIVCIGSPVVFYDLSDNGGDPGSYTWNWNFGPGATPATFTGQNPPTVTYSTTGTKTITLTYTTRNGICTDFMQRDVDVVAQPTVTFTSNSPQCTGQQFNFTYTGSAALTYMWDFGAGAVPNTSTIPNPQGITYSSAGTKTITLTINNGTCTQTATQTVTVSATPVASFASTAPKCTGLAVDFTNTGTTSGVTYAWNFGSGATPATSTVQNPTGVIYSTSGVKTVTLTTTNSTTGCVVTATNTINIYQTPTSGFSSNAPVCENTAVNFTNNSTTGIGVSYNWDFGAGTTPATSTAQNPSNILFGSSGNKTITLTVTNEYQCSATSSSVIDILATPQASFTSTAPKCTGLAVDFTNTGSASGVTYAWDFGSGAAPVTSTSQNPAGVIYSTSGVKTVTLTTTNSTTGCVVTATNTINIYQTPTSGLSSNAPVCENTAVNFTNNSTTGIGVSYNWDFGAGATPATSSSQNPNNVLYGFSGNKTVTLTVTNEFQCSATSTATFNINQAPVANFTSMSSNCTGDSVDFQNTGTTGAAYVWNFGNGATPATSTTDSPQNIVYSTSGIKTVTLITTLGSCTDTSQQTINIIQTPAPSFTTNAPQCEGSAVNFTYTGTVDTNWVYMWDFGVGSIPSSSSLKNPQGVNYAGYGSKYVLLTVSNGLCSEVASATFSINQTPVANFTSMSSNCTGDSVDFQNTGTTGAAYVWNFGSGATPATSTTDSPQNIVYSTSGIKTVTLITTLGSCTDTIQQTINIIQTPAPSFTTNAPQCEGSAINFTYTGTADTNWVYMWDFGVGSTPSSSSQKNPQNVVYLGGGTKMALLTVSNGLCSEKAIANFTINALPVANAGKDTTICADRSVQVGTAPDSNYIYSWFPSSTLNNAGIANPVSSPIANITNYVVTVQDTLTGCFNKDSVIVTMLPPLNANAGVDVEICRNESIQVGAALVEGQSYIWSPVSGLNNINLPNPVATPDSTITYTLTVTGSGCEPVTDEVTVIVHQLPKIDTGLNDSITHGSSTQLIATGGVQYEWTPSNGLSNIGIYNPIAFPDVTTMYTVAGIDIYGCKNNDSVTIYVITPSVWVPSAFTPDGNGKNDVYYVRGEGINNFEFAIFNSWGETVFYSKDISYGWDGRKQGSNELLPEGAYAYYVKGLLTNGEAVNLSGIVNLIR